MRTQSSPTGNWLACTPAEKPSAGNTDVMSYRPTRRTLLKLLLATGTTIWLPALTGCASKRPVESLNIIPRSEWGAVEPDPATSTEGVYDPSTNPGGWMIYDEPLRKVLTTIVVHHSALPLSDGPLDIQWTHMFHKGYADIGYNFVIDHRGHIYEGRSLGVRGAHTGGHNTGTVGIVLLGNFQEAEPTKAQLASLNLLSLHLAREYAITHLAGHRDFQPGVTVCPGQNLETRLPSLAAELGLAFGTQGYAGP
jgi:hypothetical protein